MRKIEAIIQPSKLEAVQKILDELGIQGATVTEVAGHGHQQGHLELYRGMEHDVTFNPKIKIEIVGEDHILEEATLAIMKAARSGRVGDGKILSVPVEGALRVRTGERDLSAL